MKFEIRTAAMKTGKLLAQKKRDDQTKIIKAILDLQMRKNGNFTNEEVLSLNSLQSQLDNIFEEEAPSLDPDVNGSNKVRRTQNIFLD